MQLLSRILAVAFAAILIVGSAAYIAFWGRPINVNAYLNKVWIEEALHSPETLTSLGFLDSTLLDFHSGRLDDYTSAAEARALARHRKARAGLNHYGPEGLEEQELLTWQIGAWYYDNLIRQAQVSHLTYVINQMSGPTIGILPLLNNSHPVTNKRSAKRYVYRVRELNRVLNEVKARVEEQAKSGVIPPDFIIEKILLNVRGFIDGSADENPIVTSFKSKLDDSKIGDDTKARLLIDIAEVIEDEILPTYTALIAMYEELLSRANHDAGLWQWQNGDDAYRIHLKSNTTTDITAEDVYTIGLKEVARIEEEMNAILVSQGLVEGTVVERIRSLMRDPNQIFPNTDKGRAALIGYLESLHDEVLDRADQYFSTLPSQRLEIVRVPVYIENSAPMGYYRSPSLDGSVPGRFYINLKDTADSPKWTLPTLMYHEGAPGHHFQVSLARGIKNLPYIRKFGGSAAYSEGWALYAERIAATDMGLYKDDPLGNLGRLQAEMFRATRLVVDTGLHVKQWSREKAISYMISKTGKSEAEVTREIERYVILPGQAPAYKIGQLAILDMRARAEVALGDDFNLLAFHDLILLNGEMPLSILDELVDNWISEEVAKRKQRA
ncbi:MAG: DUF885 family protein [Pseudomonadota bacterium]